MINLTGQIYFPNVYLETTNIDFGCILNNTEVSQEIKMTNIGPLLVNYKWKFVLEKDNVLSQLLANEMAASQTSNMTITSDSNQNLESSADQHVISNIIGYSSVETTLISEMENTEHIEEIEREMLNEQKSDDKTSKKLDELLSRSNKIELPNIEEVFDISPLYGSLHSGETQKIRVTYYGHKEVRAYVKAVCEVKNGPNYEILLKGEASVLNYEISDHLINFDYIVSGNCLSIFFVY